VLSALGLYGMQMIRLTAMHEPRPRRRAADMLAPVDQPTVELIVRLTARLSAAIFAAALMLSAAGYQHDRRRLFGARLFAGFVVAHTIHFVTVAWLAVVTAGENIRGRDGWAVVVTVALLFYMAVLLVLRASGDAAVGHSSSRSLRVTANVAVVAIAAVFLNSYRARVVRMPVYWLPALGLAGIVALYFVRTRGAALPPLRRQRSGADASG
jgi:hypothetical protein